MGQTSTTISEQIGIQKKRSMIVDFFQYIKNYENG